ncbi:hypothetical protein A9Q90_06740 [Gammaproteobacteria bacterium 54_18_T64]|nr:hypothetical protein A9Q90_06740 [Gammaproteobacteria bacterium 54_18_T64]
MSLIPETPLFFYPQLAAALGLEEAVMVQTLKAFLERGECDNQHGFAWLEINADKLLQALPFWQEADIQGITTNLREQGILLIGAQTFQAGARFRFAINEPHNSPLPAPAAGNTQPSTSLSPRPQRQAPAPIPAVPAQRAQAITRGWQPENDLLAQLAQYGIPQDFALEQVGEFVTYWTERNEPRYSWGSRYLKHVLRLWRKQETRSARQSKEVAISEGWQPSLDALDILTQQAGINRNFVEDAIPEFILYWQERGTNSSTWNSRFIQHIKRQWASFTHTLQMDTAPRPIADDWQPDESVFEILHMGNIDRNFAQNLVPEFIIYWQDSGHLVSSWNTKFLQFAKKQWAYTHQQALNTADTKTMTQSHGKQRTDRPSSTRHRSLAEDLNDRSWAT